MKMRILGPRFFSISILALLITTLFGFDIITQRSSRMEVRDFEAYMIDDVAFVSWMTSVEAGAEKVNLEKSLDGKAFKVIKSFQLNGSKSKYTFVDEDPGYGVSYYRIRHTNHDHDELIVPLVNHNGPFDFHVSKERNGLKLKAVHHHEETYLVSLTDKEGKHYLIQPITFHKHRAVSIDFTELQLESKEYIVRLQTSEWSVDRRISL